MKKRVVINLILGILISILFVASIPGIIIGSRHNTAIMVISIICLVASFYGLPFVWIHFGDEISLKEVVDTIKNEQILNVIAICNHTGKSQNTVVKQIRNAFKKGCLKGYIFDGVNLTINNVNERHIISMCPFCGAKDIIINKKGNMMCSYCKARFHK